ncbi:hypothetical protein B0T22DRAFT_224608 [Podospora appendiculata]|uniref:Pentatricopeptide repeat domain-containing protein n=1 Tax=Podospora appendiculata TaxID=314037 RepID=A0AAE0X5U3_9PEZI|nr:hypothetical protein B0T22DRAFT_224608 [Podospora appendiculata]
MRIASPTLRHVARSSQLTASNRSRSSRWGTRRPIQLSKTQIQARDFHTSPRCTTLWHSSGAAAISLCDLEKRHYEEQSPLAPCPETRPGRLATVPGESAFHAKDLFELPRQQLSKNVTNPGIKDDTCLAQEPSQEVAARLSDKECMQLLDSLSHGNDIEIWWYILDSRRRKDGAMGVGAVLSMLQKRRTLSQVSGDIASKFWQTILDEAVLRASAHDSRLLESVWDYNEWLYNRHRVSWPNIYTSIMSSFVANQLPQQAVQWHLRLSPKFGPDATTFANFVKKFIANPRKKTQKLLQTLYMMSTHRDLYDELIPYLYAQGSAGLARKWRKFLHLYNDFPSSSASKPFLRFISAYFPFDSLVGIEVPIAELDTIAPEDEDTPTVESKKDDLRYFVNRVHGNTLSIKERPYNDHLGSRWFASSWLSLDSTIDAVRLLGVTHIGPLSLQSIALREEAAEGVMRRVEQLELSGISIGDSSYSQAIRQFARAGDQLLLDNLLHSDMHPDMFDDFEVQPKVLQSAALREDWDQFYLVVAVRLAVSLDLASFISNYLLVTSLESNQKMAAFIVLDEMNARGVQVSPSASDAISRHILENVSPVPSAVTDGLFYANLCRHILPMQFPLAAEVLYTILLRKGREGRLSDLHQLSMEILQRYVDIRNSALPMFYVHELDVPAVFREKNKNHVFEQIPRDLNLRHPLHPLQRIFDAKYDRSVLRWGFNWHQHLSNRKGWAATVATIRHPTEPRHFHFARGIRSLALLRDQGLAVDPFKVRKITMLRLAEMFWSGKLQIFYHEATKHATRAGERTLIVLGEAKALCDAAWGSEILPPLPELRAKVMQWGAVWRKSSPELFRRRRRTLNLPRLGVPDRRYGFRHGSKHW